jgi:hypothetical protein
MLSVEAVCFRRWRLFRLVRENGAALYIGAAFVMASAFSMLSAT